MRKQISYAVSRVCDYFPYVAPDAVARRLRHCTYVDIQKGYLYFEVPKAACTEMKSMLRRIQGAGPLALFADGVRETRRRMFVHARSNVPLPSLVDLGETAQKEVFESPDFLRMTVVRNPYSRLLSAWRSKVALCEPQGREVYLGVVAGPEDSSQPFVSFSDFVGHIESRCDLRTCNAHWRLQTEHNFFRAMIFTLVGRVETLGDALAVLRARLGLPEPITLERGNLGIPVVGGGYDEGFARKVHKLYEQDFKLLGYEKSSWTIGSRGDPRWRPSDGPALEASLRDEIAERNLLIFSLYEERDRLWDELRHCLSLRGTLKRFPRQVIRAVGRVGRTGEGGGQ